MSDEKLFLTYDQAVTFLAPEGSIHTFRMGPGMLIGADWSRGAILEALKAAPQIEVTGETAQSMKHGLAIDDGNALFIETVRRTDTEPVSVPAGLRDGAEK